MNDKITPKKIQKIFCEYKESLCSLLLGVAFYLMTDDWFEKWKAYRLHFALSVLPFISHIVWVYANKRNEGASAPVIPSLPSVKSLHKGWSVALIAVVVSLYAGIAFWNYCAWWMFDSWNASGYPWEWLLNWYMKTNARIGEFVLRGIRLDSSRWFVWVTLPFFIMLFAYAAARLNKWRLADLCSRHGVSFVIMVISTCLLSINTKFARDYIDFAAMVNYLWPTVVTLLLVSVFVNSKTENHIGQKNIRQTIRLAAIFLIGIYCGWGTEVGCVMFFTFAMGWFAFHIWKKRYIAKECWAATLGFVWGAVALFLSPAHAGRGVGVNRLRRLDPREMTIGELDAWLDNLDWSKLELLKAQGLYVLDGIPLMDHSRFLPFLAERFWACCDVPCIVLLILLAFVMMRPGVQYRRRTILLIAMGGLGLAWLGSSSYLIACIPTQMSYLPASFIILLTCAWLFMQLPFKWVPQAVISVTMLSLAVSTYAPAAIKAYPHKHLEKEMWRDIRRQKAQNIEDIKLDRRYFVKVKGDMALVGGGRLNSDPKRFPNPQVAIYFKVKSIRVMDDSKDQKGTNK